MASIKLSNELLKKLESLKFSDEDTFEDIIWDLIEDRMELSEETKKSIAKSEKQIREGKIISSEQIKKRLGL